ncbi:FTR1 family iron permease [Hahella sp. CCB-MM4]|uniref:FTR1 family iron permease n=1 Tax=Hahella sp. (strain CCB-MM4) TaxID=1926491 RepID=UPI000B9A6105|nr:FTR1 family protein [Hahella sp. CCB-MM4]OZG75371.1 FTR1 family iron permease [Hahella sp. CCB-MM4]
MEQAIFIVWRESVEALLVIGILYAWLSHHQRSGLRYLYLGVVAGIALAAVLGMTLLGLQQLVDGLWQELFGVGMLFVAAALIVHMVFWMRRYGGGLGKQLQDQALAAGDGWALAMLACLAIGREGSETVIFLYGMSQVQSSMGDWLQFLTAIGAGIGLAVITWALLQQGTRLSWKLFFRFSEIMLLLLAGALVIGGTDRLIGLGLIPAGIDPVWDTSSFIDDTSRMGGILAALTGYRAYPALTTVAAFVGYWMFTLWRLRAVSPAGQNRA